uniref:Uncharacterized protein n=1 Tax=Ditylenchus dipsaci TaxID=166011 RepID=A0A915DWK4_9BILA
MREFGDTVDVTATIKLVGRELIKCRLLWQPLVTIDATRMVAGKYKYLVEHQTGNVKTYEKSVETSKSDTTIDKNIAGVSATVGYKSKSGIPLVLQQGPEFSFTAGWSGEWAKLQENRHTSTLIDSWSTASMSSYTSEIEVYGGGVHHVVQLVIDCSVVTWKSEEYRIFTNNNTFNTTFDIKNSTEAIMNQKCLSEELDEYDAAGLLQIQLDVMLFCVFASIIFNMFRVA